MREKIDQAIKERSDPAASPKRVRAESPAVSAVAAGKEDYRSTGNNGTGGGGGGRGGMWEP